jgi:hypothetical protein
MGEEWHTTHPKAADRDNVSGATFSTTWPRRRRQSDRYLQLNLKNAS